MIVITIVITIVIMGFGNQSITGGPHHHCWCLTVEVIAVVRVDQLLAEVRAGHHGAVPGDRQRGLRGVGRWPRLVGGGPWGMGGPWGALGGPLGGPWGALGGPLGGPWGMGHIDIYHVCVLYVCIG